MSPFQQIHSRSCDGHHDGGACAPDLNWPAAAERTVRRGSPPEDRRTQATATVIAAAVALVFWPAGLAAIAMGVAATRHHGRPRPLGYPRAVAGLTVGIVTTAAMIIFIILHAIHPLTVI